LIPSHIETGCFCSTAVSMQADVETARRLFDFARVEILMAYAVGKPLPPRELVDAALVAAGSPALSHWAAGVDA
jgi:hypothetical protein